MFKKRIKYLKTHKEVSYQHKVVNIKPLLDFVMYDFLQLYSTGYPLSNLRQTAENQLGQVSFQFLFKYMST